MQTEDDRLHESRSALERKAQLYDKLASGQCDDEDEQYNVDFLRKGTLQDEARELDVDSGNPADMPPGPLDTAGPAVREGGKLTSSFTRPHICASLLYVAF